MTQQLLVPDDIIKISVEYGRHEHIWFCWMLTTTHWYRGKGSTMQLAVDACVLNMEQNLHLGKVSDADPKKYKKGAVATSDNDLSDLF